jgi:hypothetical protein
MAILSKPYTIIPFLFFARLRPAARLLMITDHPGRTGINFDFYRISVTFCVPQQLQEKITALVDYPVLTYTPGNFPVESGPFDLVVIDLEKTAAAEVIQKAKDLLSDQGSMLLLDWSLSRQQTLRHLPRHLGWRNLILGQLSGGGPKRLVAEWYFLIEPDLNKPRYLVLPGFATAIPALSESPLKRRIIEKGFFYLQPHHKLIVASRHSAGSTVGDVISELFDRPGAGTARDKFIRKIYISTTNVLLVQVANQDRNYFIRFPFSEHSLERVKNQAELITLLNQQGIRYVPRPVELKNTTAPPCFIEEGISGKSVEKEFAEGSRDTALGYFRQALEKISKIHREFGRVVEMGEGEINRYVQPKLETVKKQFASFQKTHSALDRIAEFLRAEFTGKQMLVSVVHGDFKIGNCLFDGDGNISGIIDWDMGSKDDLAFIDISSLLGRSIRQRQRLNLADLLLKNEPLVDELMPAYSYYFQASNISPLPPFTALLFYWLDRVYKQVCFNARLNNTWITANVYPVIENLNSLLQNPANNL